MAWEVGTDPLVADQASGAIRGASVRQWSRDRIVWCDAAQEGGVARWSTFEYGCLLSTRDLSEGV